MINNNKTRHGSCSETVCPAGFSRKYNRKGKLFPVNNNKNIKGSLSLEAAAAVPLFMMICCVIISFLVICFMQMHIQIRMEETARVMGKAAFLMDQHVSPTASSGDGQTVGSGELMLMNAGMSSAGVKLMLLSDASFVNRVNRSCIRGGTSGLYTSDSSFNDDDQILDIVLNYDYKVPWIPESWGNLRLAQRMRTHVWTGRKLTSMHGGKDRNSGRSGAKEKTVYVTVTGSVYHTSPSCHYLDLSIHEVSSSNVSSLRNSDGSKYTKCPMCGSSGHAGSVYITDYGTDYHTSLECSGLKRTVMEKDISEVEGMKQCSKCAHGEHDHGR